MIQSVKPFGYRERFCMLQFLNHNSLWQLNHSYAVTSNTRIWVRLLCKWFLQCWKNFCILSRIKNVFDKHEFELTMHILFYAWTFTQCARHLKNNITQNKTQNEVKSTARICQGDLNRQLCVFFMYVCRFCVMENAFFDNLFKITIIWIWILMW